MIGRPRGRPLIADVCLIEESPVLCGITEPSPPRLVTGTRSVPLHVYSARDGSFIFNSYRDSLARKERFLKARFTWIFKTLTSCPHSFLFSRLILNLLRNGRGTTRKARYSLNHLGSAGSLGNNLEIMAIRECARI